MSTVPSAEYERYSNNRHNRYIYEQIRKDSADTRNRRLKLVAASVAIAIKLAGFVGLEVSHDPLAEYVSWPVAVAVGGILTGEARNRRKEEHDTCQLNMDYLADRQLFAASALPIDPPAWASTHVMVTVGGYYKDRNFSDSEIAQMISTEQTPVLDS